MVSRPLVGSPVSRVSVRLSNSCFIPSLFNSIPFPESGSLTHQPTVTDTHLIAPVQLPIELLNQTRETDHLQVLAPNFSNDPSKILRFSTLTRAENKKLQYLSSHAKLRFLLQRPYSHTLLIHGDTNLQKSPYSSAISKTLAHIARDLQSIQTRMPGYFFVLSIFCGLQTSSRSSLRIKNLPRQLLGQLLSQLSYPSSTPTIQSTIYNPGNNLYDLINIFSRQLAYLPRGCQIYCLFDSLDLILTSVERRREAAEFLKGLMAIQTGNLAISLKIVVSVAGSSAGIRDLFPPGSVLDLRDMIKGATGRGSPVPLSMRRLVAMET